MHVEGILKFCQVNVQTPTSHRTTFSPYSFIHSGFILVLVSFALCYSVKPGLVVLARHSAMAAHVMHTTNNLLA